MLSMDKRDPAIYHRPAACRGANRAAVDLVRNYCILRGPVRMLLLLLVTNESLDSNAFGSCPGRGCYVITRWDGCYINRLHIFLLLLSTRS